MIVSLHYVGVIFLLAYAKICYEWFIWFLRHFQLYSLRTRGGDWRLIATGDPERLLVDLIPVELSGLDRLVDVGWVEGLTDLALFPSAKCSNIFQIIVLVYRYICKSFDEKCFDSFESKFTSRYRDILILLIENVTK